MSHHSSNPSDSPMPEMLRRTMEDALSKPLIGKTDTFPEGKLSKHDEGAIQFAVGVKDGKVVIDFGTPVVWLGLNPGQALQIAESLIQNARKAAQGSGSILTLNL